MPGYSLARLLARKESRFCAFHLVCCSVQLQKVAMRGSDWLSAGSATSYAIFRFRGDTVSQLHKTTGAQATLPPDVLSS
jgi:hypothetical protein